MKALLVIAAAGVALFASTTTAGAAPDSDGVGRLAKPGAVETAGRWHHVVPPSAGFRWGAVGRWGAIGRFAAVRRSGAIS